MAEALRKAPTRPAFVRGYVIDHVGDRDLLCAWLDGSVDCGSAPSLVVEGLGPRRVSGLKTGCCALGSWSTHPVAVLGTVSGNVLHVEPEAP